jgi:hypothetical protein
MYGQREKISLSGTNSVSSKSLAKGKGCWYRIFIYACPVCGHEKVVRERQWDTKKPVDPRQRIVYDEMAYDYCLEY